MVLWHWVTLCVPSFAPGAALWPWSVLADLCHHSARGSGAGSWVLVWDPSSWHYGTCRCSGTDAGGRGQQGDLLTSQGLCPCRVQSPHYEEATVAALGTSTGDVISGGPTLPGDPLLPLSAFLLGLPGEGAFPAFLWSDLVSQYQRCAVPAMRPRSQRALAQLHRGSGLPGWWSPRSAAGVVGDKADGDIGIWGGLTTGPWAPRGFLHPSPSLLVPGSPQGSLHCPGSWRVWSSLAVLRGLGGESAAQSSPPQSRTVQNKSTQNRAAFLSSDSSAREWKRLEPTEPVTIPRTGATGPALVAPGLRWWRAGLGTRDTWWLQGRGVACVCGDPSTLLTEEWALSPGMAEVLPPCLDSTALPKGWEKLGKPLGQPLLPPAPHRVNAARHGDGHFGNPVPWSLLMLVPLSTFQSKLCWHLLVPTWGRAPRPSA